VVARRFAVAAELPGAKPAIRALAAGLAPETRCGDFAQALMDLGATVCTPRKPACGLCPWRAGCAASARGDAETFPRKAAKAEGRLRRGAAFVVTRAGSELLVRSRPPRGLLGGMTEVPTTEWSAGFDAADALAQAPVLAGPPARWRKLPGAVSHTFTHFPLELTVYALTVPPDAPPPPGTRWVALAALGAEALPSVMRKVITHALPDRPAALANPQFTFVSGKA
jgi:A/G-specific adenine glycosylase